MTSPALARLLVVEDDEGVRRSMVLALRDEGYSVQGVGDADAAADAFSTEDHDLLLIDIMLPGASGLDLCRRIRQNSHVPIILVTARDDSHDVVAGLEAGADDYVTKPFVFKELTARIRALLRRTRTEGAGSAAVMEFGDLRILPDEGRVIRGEEDISLTRTEFLLLCELAGNARRIMSRDQLLSEVWGYDYFGDGRVVDAHIRRLRTKLEPDPSDPEYVKTVRGLGYKFDPGVGGS